MNTLFERIMKHDEAKREAMPNCSSARLHLPKRARSTQHAPAVPSGRLMRICHGAYRCPNPVRHFGGRWVGLLDGPRGELAADHRAGGEATEIPLQRPGSARWLYVRFVAPPVFETWRVRNGQADARRSPPSVDRRPTRLML